MRRFLKKSLKYWIALSIVAVPYILWDGSKDGQRMFEKFRDRLALRQEPEALDLAEEIAYIQENFTLAPLSEILSADSRSFGFSEQNKKPLSVGGFEQLQVTNEEMSRIWNPQYYPVGTMANIDSVYFVNRFNRSGTFWYFNSLSFMAAATSDQVEHCVRYFLSFAMLRSKSREQMLRSMDQGFGEEIGHMNDWVGSRNLLLGQRIAMLVDVARVYQSHTFHDPRRFIESIKNPSKPYQNFLQLVEFWGGINYFYFSDSENLKNKFPQEFDLVERWMKRQDPSFDPGLALRRRWYEIHKFDSLQLSDHVKPEREFAEYISRRDITKAVLPKKFMEP
jgi:hypothetical protein